MSIFDFFKSKQDTPKPEKPSAYNGLIDKIIGQARREKSNYSLPPLTSLDAYNVLKEKDDEFIKASLYSCIARLSKTKEKTSTMWVWGSEESDSSQIIASLMSLLLRRNISFTDDELLKLSTAFVNNLDKQNYFSGIPYKPLLTKIEHNISQTGLSPTLVSALNMLLIEETPYMYAQLKSNNEQIRYLLQGAPEVSADRSDEFGSAIIDFLNAIENDELKSLWKDLMKLYVEATGKTSPTAKWMKEIKNAIDKAGEEQVIKKLEEWISLCIVRLKQIHKEGGHQFVYLKDINHDILKGMIWSCGLLNSPALNTLMDEYGLLAFKKLSGVGAVSVRTGNACLYSFSILPFKEGISRLTKFKMKIKYPSVLKQVDKYITLVAKKEGYSKDKLEEIAVPDFGIKDGMIRKPIGEYIAVIEIKNIYEVSLIWESEGKKQSSVPAKIKTDHKEELTAIKKLLKEIETLLPVQRDRIEQFYLKSRSWNFEEWHSSYIDHPLMNIVSRKLIWHFSDSNNKAQGIFTGNEITDVSGKSISWLNKDVSVQLWHPIGFHQM